MTARCRGVALLTQQRGKDCRAAVVKALAGAGDAGMSAAEMGAAAGLNAKMAAHYARTSPEAIRAYTRADRHTRWFHQDHAEAAQRYSARLADKTRDKWSQARLDQAQRLVEAAGESGVILQDLVQMMGLARTTVGEITSMLAKAKKIQRARVPHGGCAVVKLFAVGVTVPPKLLGKKKRQQRAKKARQAAAEKKLMAEVERMKKAALRAAPKATPAQIWAAQKADMSRAKVTVCPSGEDRRFKVDKPQRVFSALPPGWYVSDETWAAKVYA